MFYLFFRLSLKASVDERKGKLKPKKSCSISGNECTFFCTRWELWASKLQHFMGFSPSSAENLSESTLSSFVAHARPIGSTLLSLRANDRARPSMLSRFRECVCIGATLPRDHKKDSSFNDEN